MVFTVPVVELPPVTLFTFQVTAKLVVPVTVAVNCCIAFTAKATCNGDIETVTVEVCG